MKNKFKNDLRDGYGIIYYSNGTKYEGLFKNDLKDEFYLFYSSLGFKNKENFKNSISLKLIYFLYLMSTGKKYIFSILRNKITLSLTIILLLGILIQ